MTKHEKDVLLKLRGLRTDPNPPEEWISLSVEKEVLSKRVRAGGLPLRLHRSISSFHETDQVYEILSPCELLYAIVKNIARRS
jgi:hypothetical protein